MEDYRHLLVWQRAHALAIAVHRATRDFPSGERFELDSQIQYARDVGSLRSSAGHHLSSQALELARMLSRFIAYLRSHDRTRRAQVSA